MADTPARETALLGGGCFWCLDAAYRQLNGVTEVESGYAGGHVADPSYEEVCGKKTGHAEVVRVVHDAEADAFGEPEFLARLGRVPEAA